MAHLTGTVWVVQDDGSTVPVIRVVDQAIGSLVLNSLTVGDDFTFLTTDFSRYVDASGGSIVASLPPAIGSNIIYLAVKIDDTDNVVAVTADGNDLIDDSTSVNLVNKWSDCLLQDYALGFWHQIGGAA